MAKTTITYLCINFQVAQEPPCEKMQLGLAHRTLDSADSVNVVHVVADPGKLPAGGHGTAGQPRCEQTQALGRYMHCQPGSSDTPPPKGGKQRDKVKNKILII